MTLPSDAHPALAATAELHIFDIRGRLVQTVVGGRSDADRIVIRWNGTDTAGRSAESGVYLVQVVNGQQRLSQRLLLLK